MSRNAYFKYLHETASIVGPYIEKLYTPYLIDQEGLYNKLMLFAGTRFNKLLQKPALFRLVYEMCGGKEWERYIPVAAAFEILNISSYQSNASFDHKLGTISDSQRDAQFISSMISRELTNSALQECLYLSVNDKSELVASISHINHQIYCAQYYDLFLLIIDHFDKYHADISLYLAEYDTRCRLGSGIINGEICYWAGKLAMGETDQLTILKSFGEEFGTALQIANDIGDYAPIDPAEPNPRDYQDRFSDLKNGRLTLPLYFALVQSSSSKHHDLLRAVISGNADIIDNKISNIIMLSGALDASKEILKSVIKYARSELRKLPRNSSHSHLAAMTSITLTNKYYKAFKNLQEGDI